MLTPSPRRKEARGFALAIALALMGFILLLSLALSTLVQMQVSSMTTDESLKKARENARFGLLVALGELQKTTGPDQRVTAQAEIFTEDDAVDITSPLWLGVWDSTEEDWDELDANQRIQRAKWIVSGNSNRQGTNPDNIFPIDDMESLPPYQRVTIVRDDIPGGEDDVIVQKESITGVNGNYAYWVADENMKARVDLVDDLEDSTNHYERTWSFQGAQRSGVEFLEGLANYPANAEQTRYFADLANTVLVSQSDDAVIEELQDRYFHSLTPWSSGLLVDVKHGGLKRDLTQAFEYRHIFDDYFQPYDEDNDPNDEETSPADFIENLYFIEDEVMTANGFDDSLGIDTSGPNWSILRSYYRQYLPGGRSPKFHWNRELKNGEEVTIRNSIDVQEYNELLEESPEYLKPWIDYENTLGDRTRTYLNKYSGMQHYLPQHTLEPGGSGKPYQTVPGDQGYESVETRRISPIADNYQLQSFLGPIISRVQMSFGINDGEYGLELIVTPVFALYNPYNTKIVIEENKLFINWNLNPIITIDVDGRDRNEPVAFGLREVMPTLNQGRVTYRIHGEGEGGDLTLNPGETRYFSVNVDKADYSARSNEHGVYMLWAETDSEGNYTDVHQNGDYIWLSNYEPGLGGLIIPLDLSYEHHPAQQSGVTELQRNQDGNFGIHRPTKKRNWGLNEPEIEDLRKVIGGVDAEGNPTPPAGFSLDLQLTDDFGSGYNIGSAGQVRMQGISKFFNDVTNPNDAIGLNKYFQSLSDAANQDQLLSVGFWLKTTDEINTPWRNLIDSNIRALASNVELDGFLDDNGYPVLSTYTTEDPLGSHGVLSNSAAEIQMDDYDRATGYWGDSISASGETEVILFDRPRTPLLSLGNLQHANLGRYNFDPTYMVGNSYANVRIPMDQTENDSFESWTYPGEPGASPIKDNFKLFDTSYLVNEKLWDRYFFSGLTRDLTDDDFSDFKLGEIINGNQRYRYTNEFDALEFEQMEAREDNAELFQQLAAYLRVEGAFNVNSTSVEAWKALLGGLKRKEFPVYDNGADVEDGGLIVSRFTWPHNGKVNLDSGGGDNGNFWKGVRELSDAELENLAQAIVKQVKLRGPFLSMSDFVNRALEDDETGKSGALQAALDDPELGVNTNEKLSSFSEPAADSIPGSGFADVFPDTNMQAAGFPGYVLQGDLLQSLAPTLTVRGDTFLIRAYGEHLDPLTQETISEAWCEAVVRRTVRPVDADEEDLDRELLDPSSPLGREFKIVSFRWLSDSEI